MNTGIRVLGSRKNLPDVYIPGMHYNCFLETVQAEIRQAVYEELKRNNDIVCTGEYTDRGIQLSVKNLNACLDAYNKVAEGKKAAYKLDKRSIIRIMLENPDMEVTLISKSGKNIHHAENLRFRDVILGSEPQFREGNKHCEAKRYKQAIECYDKAISIEPLDARAWYNKGYVLFTLGKYDEAIKCFDKALDIAPSLLGGEVWNIKAKTLEELGEYEKAIECYDKALGTSKLTQK